MMPEMDGFGFTAELRRNEEWSDDPDPGLDGQGSDRRRIGGGLHGDVLGYLQKG